MNSQDATEDTEITEIISGYKNITGYFILFLVVFLCVL